VIHESAETEQRGRDGDVARSSGARVERHVSFFFSEFTLSYALSREKKSDDDDVFSRRREKKFLSFSLFHESTRASELRARTLTSARTQSRRFF